MSRKSSASFAALRALKRSGKVSEKAIKRELKAHGLRTKDFKRALASLALPSEGDLAALAEGLSEALPNRRLPRIPAPMPPMQVAKVVETAEIKRYLKRLASTEEIQGREHSADLARAVVFWDQLDIVRLPRPALAPLLGELLRRGTKADQTAIVQFFWLLFFGLPLPLAIDIFNALLDEYGLAAFHEALDGPWRSSFDEMVCLYRRLRLEERNTNLGGLFVGNFDILFDEGNCSCRILVKVKFQFATGIPAQEQLDFKVKFTTAVGAWNEAAALVCTRNPPSPCCARIPIRVQVVESDSAPHKVVDVVKEIGRESVVGDINVGLNTVSKTLTHEFGHVLANYDEYLKSRVLGVPGLDNALVFFENYFPGFIWHVYGHDKDHASVMNTGREFRKRHFEHISDWVNGHRECSGCKYEIVLLKTHF